MRLATTGATGSSSSSGAGPWTCLQWPSFYLWSFFLNPWCLCDLLSKGPRLSLLGSTLPRIFKGPRQLRLGSLLLLWSCLCYLKPFLCLSVPSFNKHISISPGLVRWNLSSTNLRTDTFQPRWGRPILVLIPFCWHLDCVSTKWYEVQKKPTPKIWVFQPTIM